MSSYLANKDTDSIHENDDQDSEIQEMEDAPQKIEVQGKEDAPQKIEVQGKEDAPQNIEIQEMEDAPQKIEVQGKEDAPQKIEVQGKEDAPQNIEIQEMEDAPQKIEVQGKEDAPQNIEVQGKEDAPQKIEVQGKEDAPQKVEVQGKEDAPQNIEIQGMEDAPQDIEIQGMEDAPQDIEIQGMEDAPDIEIQGKEDAPQDIEIEEVEQVYDLISVRTDLVLPSENLEIAHSVNEERSEKILGLRTELMMRRQFQDDTYMIAMLSPGAGDGRSQLAAELAISFARLNQPTLLIDADFRNPQQHVLFNADNKYGLSRAIESDGIPDLHSVKNFPHLVVLTAGEIPTHPLELLSSVKFERMIEHLRNNFEYVIVDTPPVSKYSDGFIIANLIRNVLTVSRAKHTSYRGIRDMLRRLRITNSQIAGGVINYF